MKIIETTLPGVLVFEPKVFGDARGFFMETWQRDRYREAGIHHDFVQDNVSSSTKGTLRGLHFQHPRGQGKLVQVYSGAVYDVAVDIRRGSSTFGHWYGVELNGDKRNQMYVPPGFAHGFYVLTDNAMFSYKCTDIYSPAHEGSIAWNDPTVGVAWPLDGTPVLSDKDATCGPLDQMPLERLPDMESYA
jgi:dTDP-4-dehydrorhamnose 3,5-epimerase